ncbi:MAG: flagellar hook-basal body protein [Verrucomicrobia bacterium]|nr:flagellar hook-basal body protein [Verrucomicrobiota bacterium]
MNVSLYQAAAAMTANERWQDVISENLASSSIPGFKKNTISFDAVQAGMMPQQTPDPRMNYTLPHATVSTSFAQGELRPTGSNTDLAIEGAGFFEVQLPTGDTAFTRDGGFHVSANGQLVNKQGFPLMGEAGPIQLDRTNKEPISISATGEVSQGAELRGKLKVVEFEKPQSLSQVGGGLYSLGQSNQLPTPTKASTVRQGFLEASNVSAVKEMAGLISTMRAFEASQRVLQMHDERMGRAISELGNPN